MTSNLEIKNIICLIVSGLLFWLSFAEFAFGTNKPLFVEAVDYKTIETVPDCEETLYRGNPRLYSRCANPYKLFGKAKTFALENKMPLVILWGFDSCPACEDLENRYFDPGFLPTNNAISASLTLNQKTQFSNYTNGNNQLALIRMNSGTSVDHNQIFAQKIGANKLAASLGWRKVWSPMFMVVNPETDALGSIRHFSGYELCTLGEELALGLEQVGIIKGNPNWKKVCSRSADYTDEDRASWEGECGDGDNLKCYLAGSAERQSYYDLEETRQKAADVHRASALNLLNKACDNGLINACRSVGYLLPTDGKKGYTEKAVNFFRRACNQRDMNACGQMGWAYKFGEGGLRENRATAVKYYAKACDSHDPWACSQIGEMAFYGDPGTTSYKSDAKRMLAFGCRNELEWACKKKYK